jgi:hypothetical protein
MANDSIMLTGNKNLFSPVSQVNYEFYTDEHALKAEIAKDKNIQCIAGHGFIPFGKTQSPSLSDYADGVDTMEFLATFALKGETSVD